jgi:hypothetical protein
MTTRSSLEEKLLEAEVVHKKVIELTQRLTSVNREIDDAKKELLALRNGAKDAARLRVVAGP